jgi:hypothetical protein
MTRTNARPTDPNSQNGPALVRSADALAAGRGRAVIFKNLLVTPKRSFRAETNAESTAARLGTVKVMGPSQNRGLS